MAGSQLTKDKEDQKDVDKVRGSLVKMQVTCLMNNLHKGRSNGRILILGEIFGLYVTWIYSLMDFKMRYHALIGYLRRNKMAIDKI